MIPKSPTVLLPASLAADSSDLLGKTIKVGAVGRSLAIFQVRRVWIYNDDDPHVKDQNSEAELIATFLRYLETPQYLRKLLFPRSEKLRHVGMLPPLRTPHHPLSKEKDTEGSFREGVVVESSGGRSLVEMGLKKRAEVGAALETGTRHTFKITGTGETPAAELADKSEIQEYWGYEVRPAGNLKEALDSAKADFRLGTSRIGSNLYGVVENIRDSKVGSLAVAFGGPYSGLFEICERQGVDAGRTFDAVVNAIPGQGTATVRMEEALTATLALLNLLLRE